MTSLSSNIILKIYIIVVILFIYTMRVYYFPLLYKNNNIIFKYIKLINPIYRYNIQTSQTPFSLYPQYTHTYKGTNHCNTGWISVDRRTKPTLNTYNTRMLLSRLQMIYHSQQSSVYLANWRYNLLQKQYQKQPGEFGPKSILSSLLIRSGEQHRLSSMDSDLEAFSHYPTDVSVAALAFQPTAFTNYLIEQFLSY